MLRRRDLLVFCEVKTRAARDTAGGFEAVDARKRRKLRALAEVFLLTHGAGASSVRFDVASVAVLGVRRAVATLESSSSKTRSDATSAWMD